jgi:tetratricopeptide (TPR) repeat protein
LDRIFSRTKSNRIGYWYFRTAVGYYLNVFDYKLALKFSKLLLNLIENVRNLNNPVNIAGASNELAKVFILNKQYKDSIPLIHKALSLFNQKLNNYLSTLGTLFLAYFHLEKFDLCMEIYEQAILHPKFKEKKDNVSIWNYYKTCLYFKKGLYKEALNSLNQDANALALNKSELFVFSRILYLFLLFETNKSILWSYELASFRKTFPSIRNYKIDRLKIVFFILNKLDKEDFDFPYVEARESEKFEKLQVIPNIWKPLGFELISFESWFKEKTLAFNKTSKQKRKK